jgi:hypothetical protein
MGAQSGSLAQIYEPPYNSAHTYTMHPPEQMNPGPQSNYNNMIYYPSSLMLPITGEAGINSEEEIHQTETAQSQPSGTRTEDHYYHDQVYPLQQVGSEQHIQDPGPRSPIARWASEPLADERCRLGLPPYATQAEVQAARRASEAT